MERISPISYIRKQQKLLATTSMVVAFIQIFGQTVFVEQPQISNKVDKNTYLPLEEYSSNPFSEDAVEDYSSLLEKETHDEVIDKIFINEKEILPAPVDYISSDFSNSDYIKEPEVNKQGIIGKSETFPIDDPSDNIFPLSLNELPSSEKNIYLTYEIYGLADASGASVTINDNYSRGGYLIKKSNAWSVQKEKISHEELNEGVNFIRFSTLERANYQYMVRNVQLIIEDKKDDTTENNLFTIHQTQLNAYDGKLYISGFADKTFDVIMINEIEIPVRNGIFESIIENVGDEIKISQGNQITTLPIINQQDDKVDNIFELSNDNTFVNKQFFPATENLLSHQGASLKVAANSIDKETTFFMSALRYQDLSVVSPEMVNVTGNHSGYRLLPHGEHFTTVPATLEIPYDESKIPAGYKPQDIKTFYFDLTQKKWIALERDTILLDKKIIVSKTSHFTDFVNGIIKVPESPETGSFTPTSIKDIKAADPAAGVVSIAPPTPNNMGTANTSFPIKLPAGRAGMQPSLSVNYNSEGGNGWMGIGWDLSVPAISIDTRWGAPRFDESSGCNGRPFETEIYSLAGEMLTMKVGEDFTNPHRTSDICRIAGERQFYPRKEHGSYLKVVRYGTSPKNYWWEVTDKMGNKSIYGDPNNPTTPNAVIKTADGNIAHWALYRTEDTNGNYVEYSYDSPIYLGAGAGNTGKEFYLKNIIYTQNKNESPGAYYQVNFIRNNYSFGTASFTERKDININARLGLVQVISDNLTEIHIDYVYKEPQRIRTYQFEYDAPNFSKQQLVKISEFDADDMLFYSNTLEYYSEVTDNNIMNSNTDLSWDGINDNINVSPKLPSAGEKFVWKGSPFGFNNGNGYSGGLSAGVGLGSNFASKQNTVGVTYDYSFSKNTGYISFIDINGDNLPDKVFKTSSGLKYRLNLGENKGNGTPFGFGPIQSLSGSNNFLESTSNSHSVGLESNFLLYLGYTKNFSKNVTKVYYADVNGDGLIDIVNNGRVLFNPGPLFSSFNIASLTTPNLIPSDTSLNSEIIGDINDQLDEDIERDNPLQDIIKKWVAPTTGTINISGIAKLSPMPIPLENDESLENNDGVCISVEHHRSSPNTPEGNPTIGFPKLVPFGTGSCGANKYALNFTLDPNGDVISNTAAMNTLLSVTKGDRLYFRVQSKEEGTHDRVEWDPTILYTGTNNLDANALSFFSSSASEGFILSGEIDLAVPKNKAFSIKWDPLTITPNQYSDDLTFKVIIGTLNNDGVFIPGSSYTRTVDHTNLSTYMLNPSNMSPVIPATFTSVNYDRIIRFEVTSDSNVDWKQINWKPYVEFEENTNSVRINGVVNYGIYNYKPWTEGASDINLRNINRPLKLIISYNDSMFSFPEDLEAEFPEGSYPVSLVIKNSNKQVIGKRLMTATVININFLGPRKVIQLSNIGDWIIDDTSKFTPKIYVDFFTVNKHLANHLSPGTEIYDKINATQYEFFARNGYTSAKIGNDNFGPNYRFWGHFAYNGNEPGSLIDESKLKLPEIDENNIPDSDVYDNCGDDPDCFEANSPDLGIDPQSIPFIILVPNANKQFEDDGPYYEVWEGNDPETYVQANAMSSSRLGVNDLESIRINFDGIVDAGAVRRMPLVSKGDGNSYAGSFGAGPVGAGGSISDNDNKTLIQYMDLNGDRYPDIITENKIQYTNSIGKLNEVVPNNLGIPSESETNGEGATASGTFINFSTPASTQDVQKAIAKSRGIQVAANADVQLPSSAGINVSGNWSETEEKSLWIDMNGDGLPDKVNVENGQVIVKLNLGHSFETTGYVWRNNVELKSKNSNFSGGIGFSIWMNSIAGGVSVSAGESYTEQNFIDLNGDGLPDFVENPNGNAIRYYLNTGNGFSTSYGTINNATVNMNRSVGEGANIAFTVGFSLIIAKFTVTPRISISKSVDRTEKTIADINGDGLPDILYTATGSNANDGDLKVRLNKTGKTHLLKKVYTPLGGSWTIDYEREQNSYEMPNAKWKLTSINVNDNFSEDNAFTPDEAKSTVEYENPKHDRREREFMGYETVKVNQLDVKNNDEIYRYSLQEFHNNSYYLKGAVKKESLFGKNQQGSIVEWTSTESSYAIMLRGTIDPSVQTQIVKESDYVFNSGDFGNPIDKSSLFVSPIKTIKTFTEGGTGSKTTFTEIKRFDEYGNITRYVDNGEGGDDEVTTSISYQTSGYDTQYFKGFPLSMRVVSSEGWLRQRGASYDFSGGTANLTSVSTYLNEAEESAVVSFEYDDFGNIQKVIHEESVDSNNQKFFYEYTYDDKVHTYPINITDAFGYSSNNTYEYLFGTLVYTEDMNYQPMRTRIDKRGRVVEITGPYELFVEGLTISDPAWTIRFEYKGEESVASRVQNLDFNEYMIPAKGKFNVVISESGGREKALHYAVTRHFDPEFRSNPETPATDNEIYTITLADGLGRPIQVKKSTSIKSDITNDTAEITKTVIDNRETRHWLVNGKVQTDAFGRAEKTYYPILEAFNTSNPLTGTALLYNADTYNTGEPLIPPTEATYDALDRVLTTKLPGESFLMTTSYSIDQSLFKTRVVNESGQAKHSFTDIRGRTTKVVEESTNAGTITTEFKYNAIGELQEVKDTDGNITESKYDKAGRRTELRHPDNGITKFTYDNASNLIEKETSNLLAASEGDKIKYKYTFNRLDSISYPLNPHNNVQFFYGQAEDASAADDFTVGRLWYQIDASGVQQFKYGRLGEVTYNLRSVAVPGDKAYWFQTKWEYDTWNRVKKIIYPDEEEVTYFYNRGGELHAITSKKQAQQNENIISQLGYDKFGQRTYLRYGNGTETNYEYEDNRRRLDNMTVNNANRTFLDNNYNYDVLSNVTSVMNSAALPGAGKIGGATEYIYTYDDLNRLKTATGIFTGRNAADDGYEQQQYSLEMSYDKMHNILSKEQLHQKAPGQSGGTWTDIPATTYRLDYMDAANDGYNSASYNVAGYSYSQPHAPRKIIDKPYETSTGNDIKIKMYEYDANGNMTHLTQATGESETVEKLRTNLWDEENRLRAVDITPDAEGIRPIAIYTYDAGGERILKHNNTSVSIYLNGKKVADEIKTDAMLYPSGMVVARLGSNGDEENEQTLAYTKHYYAGTQRVSSKIGTTENLGDFLQDWFTGGIGGPVDVVGSSNQVIVNAEQGVIQVYDELGIDTPEYNSNPVFYPVQSFTHGATENEIYWFHPDHLGSTSYITNVLGEVSQHMEYFAFGETFVEEHRSSNNSPYKFNGKELDEETGWYYYGARYYDARTSVWLSVDPLAEKYPNISPYAYCAQNPIVFIDPDGERIIFVPGLGYDPNDPSPYVSGFEESLKIYLQKHNTYSKTIDGSFSTIGDMLHVMWNGQKPLLDVAPIGSRIHNVASGIAQDIINNPLKDGEQNNIVGASQGSVTVAQAVIQLLVNPEEYGLDGSYKIDNLVLVGSPIHEDSKLMDKLYELKDQGKIGNILYEDYQSKDKNGKYNDRVTGLASKSKVGALAKGIGFIFKMLSKSGRANDPHYRASQDLPPNPGDPNFSTGIIQKLEKDGVH
ncbi:RHS repeat-associated core domain-containing protein [Moheibacter sediminis]|uniref:RHS repeat-associated core domain-containing protein n=1 Tax=Moheibacter sediminis TaxID=1434700 RepID=A0A1W1ZDC6_9FLAO|nr:SpvB/TcaC N-terminal domain-containing protein [Moheibacter sediminis]SMC46161.1 RHS repeat-associated core domain-containing protein [Moheibacter sediminis]